MKAGRMLGELVFRAFITLRALWAPVSLGVNAAVFNDRGQVLLVQHRYTPGWRLPGDGVDRGEPPELAVMRELAEEVGLSGGRCDRRWQWRSGPPRARSRWLGRCPIPRPSRSRLCCPPAP